MLLTRVISQLLGSGSPSLGGQDPGLHRHVLCIASVAGQAVLPGHYAGWNKDYLSERPLDGARFVKSVLRLTELPAATYDAVYYSHQLNHFSLYQAGLILHGVRHMLTPGGFLHLKVIDVMAIIHQLSEKNHDLEDIAYLSAAGPISYHDVLWGQGIGISHEGSASKSHRTGFSRKILDRLLFENGFLDTSYTAEPGSLELEVIAAAERLHEDYRIMMGLKPLERRP